MLRTGWTYRQLLDTPARVLDALVEELVSEQRRQSEQMGQAGEQVIEMD